VRASRPQHAAGTATPQKSGVNSGVRNVAFWIFIVVVALYAIATGYTDLRMQRIPNYLTVPMAIGGLIFFLVFGPLALGSPTDVPLDVRSCLLGFALGFAIFFIPFLLRGGGAGDLKLVAALGAWLGWFYLLIGLVFALIFALVVAFVVWTTSFSASNGKAKNNQKSGDCDKNVKTKVRRKRSVRFAIPMALGTWCVLGMMILKHFYK